MRVTGQSRERKWAHRSPMRDAEVCLCPARRSGASHERICDFGIMGVWYSRVPRNRHDLHPLPGWTHTHIPMMAAGQSRSGRRGSVSPASPPLRCRARRAQPCAHGSVRRDACPPYMVVRVTVWVHGTLFDIIYGMPPPMSKTSLRQAGRSADPSRLQGPESPLPLGRKKRSISLYRRGIPKDF